MTWGVLSQTALDLQSSELVHRFKVSADVIFLNMHTNRRRNVNFCGLNSKGAENSDSINACMHKYALRRA